MNQLDRFSETVAAYQKHGWKLRRVLMRAETMREARAEFIEAAFESITPEETLVDALWFSRASHAGREAWELRLVGATPYALFETFEADEDEEVREDLRREMQARLTEHAARD
jgi:hypothetical protein